MTKVGKRVGQSEHCYNAIDNTIVTTMHPNDYR